MRSTFFGIEIAKRAVLAHQRAMDIIGHNLANANRPEYHRQKVEMVSATPYGVPGFNRPAIPGQIGQGVTISIVKRLQDIFIEGQILAEKQRLGEFQQKRDYLTILDSFSSEFFTINPETEGSLRVLMDQFWKSWQDLNGDPDSIAIRTDLRNSARTLAQAIATASARLGGLRQDINAEIQAKVSEINDIAARIALINRDIQNAQGAGEEPNDLLDTRDKYVGELAKLINVSEGIDPTGEHIILIGSTILVQGVNYKNIIAEGDPSTGDQILVWDYHTPDGRRVPVDVTGGELKGLLDVRDIDLKHQQVQLDDLAIALIDYINEKHYYGYDLDGVRGRNFFQPFSAEKARKITSTFAVDATLTLDNAANFGAVISAGAQSFTLNGIAINYNAAVDTLTSLAATINGVAGATGVSARVDSSPQGSRLTLISNDGKPVNLSGDTGNLLQLLGLENVYKVVGDSYINDATSPLSRANLVYSRNGGDFIENLAAPGPIQSGTITIGTAVGTASIQIDVLNDSLQDVVDKINAVSSQTGIVASIRTAVDSDIAATVGGVEVKSGSLVLRATLDNDDANTDGDYKIAVLQDTSGNVLEALGIITGAARGGFADGALRTLKAQAGAASRIDLSPEIKADVRAIAAGTGLDTSVPADGLPDSPTGPGNGTNALNIASIQYDRVMFRGTATFLEFFSTVSSEVGRAQSNAEKLFDNQELLLQNLQDQQQAVSGVSIDEEMADMITFQHSYEAAARVIRVMDEMIGVILGIVG
ncbi:MAG: flagellar hook-associated protein FlgK [bacterium]